MAVVAERTVRAKAQGLGELVTQNCLIVRALGFQRKNSLEVRVGF